MQHETRKYLSLILETSAKIQIQIKKVFFYFKPSLGGPVSEVAGFCNVAVWHRNLSLSWQRFSGLDSGNADGISPIKAISAGSPHSSSSVSRQKHPAAGPRLCMIWKNVFLYSDFSRIYVYTSNASRSIVSTSNSP